MNQPVWNIGSLAPNSESNAKKVRKSNSELTGPSTSMKRSMNLMFQRTGLRQRFGIDIVERHADFRDSRRAGC